MNIISDFHIFFTSWAFVSHLRLSSEELGNRLQTPTLIGCKFLMNRRLLLSSPASLWSAKPWIMTQFLWLCQIHGKNFRFLLHYPLAQKETPSRLTGRFRCNSLTMTYFHTGTRTIIGAEAFHCPVRDGKEWYHFAMVVRHNFLSSWLGQDNQFIELISFIDLTNLCTISWAEDFWMRQLGITSLMYLRRSKL